MLKKDFGVLCAPPGSGKTVMALFMMAQRRQPALIVVHTKELAFQWLSRIETFLGIPETEVGLIGAGQKKIGDITVALVQTLYKCREEIAPRIGYLIVDECHRIPSRTFTEAISGFDAKFMLGLSATPYRRDKLTRVLYWHLGDMHHRIDDDLLIEKGDILQTEVVFRETSFQPYTDPVSEYSKMLSELTADDGRNHLIAADVAEEAEKRTGVCLVLSDRKKHCETLRAILRHRYHLESTLLTGDLSISRRREVLEELNRGDIQILLATGQLIGEGFDFEGFSSLFIATPIRFSGRLIQYLGRIMRTAPGKDRAKVFDYVDVRVGPLRSAAMARQRVYGRGEFMIDD